VWRKAHTRRGEVADSGQHGIGEGVPSGEVGPRVKGGGKYEAQPSKAGL